MGKKRVTIDVDDDDGATYRMSVTGSVTREKLLRVFEAMNLIDLEEEQDQLTPDTVGERIWAVIDKQYPLGHFTSANILEKYEDEYNLPIKLSVVSTYLARFTQRGRIARHRRGRQWSYHTNHQHTHIS